MGLNGGANAGDFIISADGELRFKQEMGYVSPTDDGNGGIDNSANEYEVIVRATDESGLDSTQTITVTVLDDLAPVFTCITTTNLTQEQKDAAPQGVTGNVQPMGGAQFIVEEGTDQIHRC